MRRLVPEKTDWRLAQVELIGVRHYHYLERKPPAWDGPYPDSRDVVFSARPATFLPEALPPEGSEAEVVPGQQGEAMFTRAGEGLFLKSSAEREAVSSGPTP